jgi:hypothetical protein
VINYDFPSAITRSDLNYWDAIHYRLPIGHEIARELGPAVLEGRQSEDGVYRFDGPLSKLGGRPVMADGRALFFQRSGIKCLSDRGRRI